MDNSTKAEKFYDFIFGSGAVHTGRVPLKTIFINEYTSQLDEAGREAVDKIYSLNLTSSMTIEKQALHSIEQRKEIETIKSANEFLSKCVDSRQQEIEELKARCCDKHCGKEFEDGFATARERAAGIAAVANSHIAQVIREMQPDGKGS